MNPLRAPDRASCIKPKMRAHPNIRPVSETPSIKPQKRAFPDIDQPIHLGPISGKLRILGVTPLNLYTQTACTSRYRPIQRQQIQRVTKTGICKKHRVTRTFNATTQHPTGYAPSPSTIRTAAVGRLSNRFSHDTHGKLIGQIHARIPIPTPDEQRALQKDNAEADERFWSNIQHMNAAATEKRKDLLASTQSAIADGEAAAKDAGAKAEHAKERLAKIEKGEDVQGGLGRPMTREDLRRISGMSDEQIQHCMDMFELRLSDEEMERLVHEQLDAGDRAGRAIVRRLLRERRGDHQRAPTPPPADVPA
jgi:hypothetical protein